MFYSYSCELDSQSAFVMLLHKYDIYCYHIFFSTILYTLHIVFSIRNMGDILYSIVI